MICVAVFVKELHPCCCKWHYFITLLQPSSIPLCVHLFIHSPVGGHLGCFRVLAIVSGAAVNTGVCVSLQILVFVFSRICLGEGSHGSHGNSFFLIF